MMASMPMSGSSASLASAAEALRGAGERERRAALTRLVQAFHGARTDTEYVVLEGFHPLKHALRFGAHVELVASAQDGDLARLVADHAPELAARIAALTIELPREDFRRLGPYEPHTGVVSVAVRSTSEPLELLASPDPAPVVLLEDPRHRGNIGAVVRVAAAAGAAGVLVTGAQDPWHPVVVRGSAGLHFALPVGRLERLPTNGASAVATPAVNGREHEHSGGGAGAEIVTDRPLVVLDPEGASYDGQALPPRALLAFGSERRGVSEDLARRAQLRLRLPMRAGVSSLNLATSVAAVLYGMRFGGWGNGAA